METFNIAIGVICFGVILWGLWQLFGGPMTQPDVDFQLGRFTRFLANLESSEDDYKYYEISNLIWAETNRESIKKQIETSSQVRPGIIAPVWIRPSFYHFRVNEETRRVYFAISDQNQFDWDGLPHYAEYSGESNI